MRELRRGTVSWWVREVDAAGVPGARAPQCLIFDCEGVVRRVWSYPRAWADLPDDSLWSLLNRASPPPPIPPRTQACLPPAALADGRDVAAAAAAVFRSYARQAESSVVTDSHRSGERDRRLLADQCRLCVDEMREAVVGYSAKLKREGVPPERAVILLRTAVEGGLGRAGSSDAPGTDALIDRAVSWGIEGYFAGP